MADVTPGCEIAARLANDVRRDEGLCQFWTAINFVSGTCETDSDAFARLCDHLHNTLNSDASDSTKLTAIRDYIEPVDPWLAAMREAFAVAYRGKWTLAIGDCYRNGTYDSSVKKSLAAFRAKLGDAA